MGTVYNPGVGYTPTSDFGIRPVTNPKTGTPEWQFHPGKDWGAIAGTNIQAAAGGKVIYAEKNAGGYGNTVIIEHTATDGSKYWTMYAHMKDGTINVSVGDKIDAGQSLGQVGGTTGVIDPETKQEKLYGPHLHFEVIVPPEGDVSVFLCVRHIMLTQRSQYAEAQRPCSQARYQA